MKNLLSLASLSALLVGAAIPAHATTFAYVSGLHLSWTASTSGPVTGTLTSTGTNIFDYSVNDLPTGLAGELVFTSLGETGANSGSSTLFGTTTYGENNISGSFYELYEGPTQTLNGVNLVSGVTELLAGNLTNGELAVQGTTGQLLADVAYTSSAYPLAFTQPETVDFTIAVTHGTPGLTTRNTISTLKSFQGTATGQFLAASVAEPAAWMMMLGGVGFTGGVLRRRRLAVLPA